MKKTTLGASIKKHKLKSQHYHRRRGLSADELSVFSSALRPCLRFLLDSNIKKSALATILGVAGLFLLGGASPVYAEDASITLTVPTTISVAISPGSGVNTATGKITINTNANFGYTLGIKAKEAGGNLKHSDAGVTATIESIAGNTATALPSEGNVWGWRYGEWEGSSGDPNPKAGGNFLKAPSTSVTQIAKTTTAGNSANKDYYLTVGARVDADQPKGTYSKDFIITATATEQPYTITYYANDETTAKKDDTTQRTFTKNATFVPDKTTARTGYELKGWCTTATTNNTCPSPAKTCALNATCNMELPANKTINLYAVWESPFDKNSVVSMQDYGRKSATVKTQILNALTKDVQYTLKDERDSRLYYVSKLADNNIWMTENLDLSLSTGTKLTTSNTDIPVDWTPARSSSTTWTDDGNTPYSYEPGNRCWDGTVRNTRSTISDDTVAKNCNKHDSSHYHVGNYYNWTSAVAMNNSQYYTTYKQNVNQSVCPKGWQLPVYEGNKSFVNLKNAVTNAGGTFTAGPSGTIHKTPFYFTYTGDIEGTSTNAGGHGFFWSSVVRDSGSAHYVYFNYSGNLNLQDAWSRSYGRPVRCIARTGGTEDISGPKTIADISTMQQYGNLPKENKTAIKASMTTNTQYELKDERDDRMYYIAKLADGNIWMTENLDLDLSTSKTLTPSDTDIPANWTPTRSTLTTTTGWSEDYNTPYSYDPGNRCWNGTITSTNLPIADNTVAKDCSKHDSSHYYVGNYYNWSAAVAKSNTSSYTTNGTNVNQSICPKGWQLPVYSGNKSFINLKNAAALTSGFSGTIHQAPFYFPYSGFGNNSGVSEEVGYVGIFWSSVVNSSSYAYRLRFHSNGYLGLQDGNSRYLGHSIRCVARDE